MNEPLFLLFCDESNLKKNRNYSLHTIRMDRISLNSKRRDAKGGATGDISRRKLDHNHYISIWINGFSRGINSTVIIHCLNGTHTKSILGAGSLRTTMSLHSFSQTKSLMYYFGLLSTFVIIGRFFSFH